MAAGKGATINNSKGLAKRKDLRKQGMVRSQKKSGLIHSHADKQGFASWQEDSIGKGEKHNAVDDVGCSTGASVGEGNPRHRPRRDDDRKNKFRKSRSTAM